MSKINELQTPAAARFFAILEELYPASHRRYDCHVLSDLDFTAMGVLRCLSHARTGHEFLQHHADHGGRSENPDLFFKALKSKRRLQNLKSLNQSLALTMATRIPDPLSPFPELNGFHFFAVDGHYQQAACFDPRKPSRQADKPPRKTATGHFFRVNLRNHDPDYLDLSRPADGKKKDHDARVIQRVEVQTLRATAAKGEKVIYFWDKARIDYRSWHRLKQRGIYFVTREKSNSALQTITTDFTDHNDPRNQGIINDTLVGTDGTGTLRLIRYTDPRDGTTYSYLTNELTPHPWSIVLGCKHRWDIEKIHDHFKNKMNETKSWASRDAAKEAHAIFQCLAHNLALLLEQRIKVEEQLVDQREAKKRSGRAETLRNRKGELLRDASDFIATAIQRATQRTLRFIRWLRAWLHREAPWRAAMARLPAVWADY